MRDKINGQTKEEAQERLDEAAKRLREMGIIMVKTNQPKVPASVPYEEEYR